MGKMTALRLMGWGRTPELVEVPIPEPGPGQVRVRVAAAGLCHSDIAMTGIDAELGSSLGWQVPFTIGHETSGWVDGVGSGVSGWSDGEPVILTSPASCGSCRRCDAGRENACAESLVGRGYGRDGGAAQWVTVDRPARSLLRLGSLDPATAAPLADAAATSHHAVARLAGRVGEDSVAVVIGVGGLGAFAVQLLRALTPARVVAVDPDPKRRQVASELGAHAVAASSEPTEIRELLDGIEVDAVVDMVGTDATIAAAVDMTSPGGGIAIVGAGGGTLRRPWFGGLPRDAEIFTFQGSDIADLRAVVALAAEGSIINPVDPHPLEEAPTAWTALADGATAGRVILQP